MYLMDIMIITGKQPEIKQGKTNGEIVMLKSKKQQEIEQFLVGKTIVSVDADGIWLDDSSLLKWSGKLTIEALPPGTILVKRSSDSE